jgi:polyisoprenoid-binding protein YceI
MRTHGVGPLVVAAILSLAPRPGAAQIPDKYTNLQVLPKDMSREDLVRLMRGWTGALGVRCDHCHTGGNPQTLEGVDFAADAKREKRTARDMFRMVRALNSEYLAKLEPRTAEASAAPSARVECVTCHRGLSRPDTINAVLDRALAKDGVAAALKTYKDMRAQLLASGRYDFSQGPLNTLAERLLAEGRGGDALPFLELNAENYPTGPWILYLLGEARLAAGDRPGALEAYERSLAAGPDNPRARKRADELKASLPPRPAGVFVLEAEPNHSSIGFTIPIAHGMTRVTGKFTAFTATIRFQDGDLSQCAVEASIQAASVDTGIGERDVHLRQPVFFDASAHPLITFKSSRVERRGDGYVARGKLSMRGAEREVELPFQTTGLVWEDGKPRLGISARLSVDRRDFGVGNDWKHTAVPDFLGGDVTIEIFLWTKLGKPVANASRD